MNTAKFPRKSVRSTANALFISRPSSFCPRFRPTFTNNMDLVKNADPRFQSFDPKDSGINEPEFYHESKEKRTKKSLFNLNLNFRSPSGFSQNPDIGSHPSFSLKKTMLLSKYYGNVVVLQYLISGEEFT